MSIGIQWLGHAAFRIANDVIIYIDPWKLTGSPHDAGLILVSHNHYDHYSEADIEKVASTDTHILGSCDAQPSHPNTQPLTPGQSIEILGVRIEAVPAYNPRKQFHPRQNNWLGFVIELAGKRIYYAGDTDIIDEMTSLTDIDLALLPVGGTYTMNADEAARAAERIKPTRAIPYHWGDIVGTAQDAQLFARQASCDVSVLNPGQSLEL